MLHANFMVRREDCRQVSSRSANRHSSPISTRQHNASRTLAYSVADGISQIHEAQFNKMLILCKFFNIILLFSRELEVHFKSFKVRIFPVYCSELADGFSWNLAGISHH